MALSDFIRKIEQSPRSTKITGGIAVAATVAAGAFAWIALTNNAPGEQAQVRAQPTPTVQRVVPTARPAPTPIPATPTPIPAPTSTPTPVTVAESVAATPTARPAPTATPRSNDYHVILEPRFEGSEINGAIRYFASLGGRYSDGASVAGFRNSNILLDHFLKEGVITSEQKADFFDLGRIKIPIREYATAMYTLSQDIGYRGIGKDLGLLSNYSELMIRI